MEYRILNKNEFKQAADLSLEVFTQCGTQDFNAEGLVTFKSFIYSNELMDELTIYGAFEQQTLIGVLGTKRNGVHISLFFIQPAYHRKGIGKRLFNLAIQDKPVSEMTVNSSSYAIEVYKKLGFKPIAEEQETNGLRYTPMKRSHICQLI